MEPYNVFKLILLWGVHNLILITLYSAQNKMKLRKLGSSELRPMSPKILINSITSQINLSKSVNVSTNNLQLAK